jgi:mono/diheme cytochrome c family protein
MKAGMRVILKAFLVAGAMLAFSTEAIAQQGGGSMPIPRYFSRATNLRRQLCRVPSGRRRGTPPTFRRWPAMTGSRTLIGSCGRSGSARAMLAFPQLSATEIAAVATYVRNAWNNKFGAATADQVTTILAGLPKTGGAKISVWSGVYTAAQNERGEELYSGACAQCHGLQLNGAGQPDQPPSPAIARATFLRKWAGQTVAALFVYIHTKMPPEYPGTLTEQQSIDAIAYMFAVSKMPAGDKELPTDRKALENIVIEAQPK